MLNIAYTDRYLELNMDKFIFVASGIRKGDTALVFAIDKLIDKDKAISLIEKRWKWQKEDLEEVTGQTGYRSKTFYFLKVKK